MRRGLSGYHRHMSEQGRPDLTPDPPGGRDASDDDGKQVSEVQNLDDAGQPISDSQAVTGQPTADGEDVQVTAAGPNDAPRGNREAAGHPERD